MNTSASLGKALLIGMAALALVACGGGGGTSGTGSSGNGNTGGTGGTGGTTQPPPDTPPENPPPVTNHAPTLGGTPVTTAKVGVAYSYQPTASDPDGDTLTFSIANKPGWATFDTASGLLAGTPPEGANGTVSGIRITVSDGKLSTSASPFDLSVTYSVVGAASLAWQPPTENEDGTPLADLAGYVLRYGRDANALDKSISISNPGITQYVVDGLAEGTWYFTLSSLNRSGVESRPTGVVAKAIS